MKFEEALDFMRKGRKAKRPDDCDFHVIYDNKLVTEGYLDHEVELSSEDLMANDWYLKVEKPIEKKRVFLNIGDAIQYAKNEGKNFTKGSWCNPRIYIYYYHEGITLEPALRVKTINGRNCVWSPNHQELLATDWHIIE